MYIKLDDNFMRLLMGYESSTIKVFLYLLFTANTEDAVIGDVTVLRGQKLTSIREIARSLKLSFQQVRTALKKLYLTQHLTQLLTQGQTLITICKYESYNDEKTLPNTAPNTAPNTGQEKGTLVTTCKYESYNGEKSLPNAATNAAQREERKERKEAKEIIKEIREITKKPRKQVYVSKKDELSLACVQDCDARFYDWVKVNAPYITSHYTHLVSTPELQRLKEKYTTRQICDSVLNIENRQDLRKKYTNLYRTLINWLKRDEHGTNINNGTRPTAEQRKQEFAAEIMRMQQQDAANREKIRQCE